MLYLHPRYCTYMAGKSKNRNLRADDIWDRALAIAHSRGESLAAEIRAFLARYVKQHEKDGS